MRSLFMIILMIGWAGLVRAQTRSLDYYMNHAINNSPRITEQRYKADSARLQKRITKADLDLPLVSATGDYVYAPFSEHWGYDEAITDGGLYSALLNIDYFVFTSKNKRIRQHTSSISIRQSDYQIENIKHDLSRSVTDQYITAHQDEMHMQYLEGIRNLLEQQQRMLQSLTKQGVSQITNLKQINIELQNNRIARKDAENIYQQDVLQLNVLCGINDSSTSVQLQQPAIRIDSVLTQRSRFMDQFMLDSLQAAADQNVSELKYQPRVSVFGNSGLNAIKFKGVQNHFGYSVGLHVSVPIFDGNQKSLTRQQTRLQQQSIGAYQQRFKTNRALHLASLQKQLKQAEERLNLLRQQLAQYKDLLSDYRKELGQGILSVVDYLTVLRNYADSRQQQVQALSDQLRIKNEYNYWNW